MKKCPYCAEEIQDTAVKCRYCGEWVVPQKTKSDEKESSKIGSNIFVNNDTKNSQSISEKVEDITIAKTSLKKDAIEESKFTSILSFIRKHGAGGFILACLYGTYVTKIKYVYPLTIFITNFGAIILLVFYYWCRKRIISKVGKSKYINKVWEASFIAGVISYLVVSFLVGGLQAFVGGIEHSYNIKNNIENLKLTIKNQREKEIQVLNSLINPPKSYADTEYNLKKINGYLLLVNERDVLSKDLTRLLNDELCIRKNDKKVCDVIEQLRVFYYKNLRSEKECINMLKKYYTTGDKKYFNEYENKLREKEFLENEVKKWVNNIQQNIK